MTTQEGRYVRIEGADGTGKSTQIEMARRYSEENGLDAVFVREPGGTDFGLHIRRLLLEDKSVDFSPETETLLFMADRAHLMSSTIMPALSEGKTVIGDRGIESTSAYQAAGGGVAMRTVMEIGRLVLPKRYMEPDAIILLDVPREVREARMAAKSKDKIELRASDYFDRIDKAYGEMQQLPRVQVIDANHSETEVFEQIRPIMFGAEHA